MMNILEAKGLKNILYESNPDTTKEILARQLISVTLDHSVVDKVLYCEKVNELWAALESIYENKTSYALTDLISQMNSYRIESLDKVEAGISEIRSAAVRIRALGGVVDLSSDSAITRYHQRFDQAAAGQNSNQAISQLATQNNQATHNADSDVNNVTIDPFQETLRTVGELISECQYLTDLYLRSRKRNQRRYNRLRARLLEKLEEDPSINLVQGHGVTDATICFVCKRNKAVFLYSPCKHVITCTECQHSASECQRCGETIRLPIKIYLP